MLCYHDLLSKKKLSEDEVSTILEKSKQNVLSGLELLQNAKGLFSIQAELKKLTLSPHSLGKVFSTKYFEAELLKKNLHFDVQIETDGSVLINPEYFISDVLNPLIDNAIKFSHRHGMIEIRVWEEASELKLSIRDFGIGLRSHHQVRAGTAGEIGEGLSLMKARLQIHHLGGSMSIEAQDPGTVVLITLPLVTLYNDVSGAQRLMHTPGNIHRDPSNSFSNY